MIAMPLGGLVELPVVIKISAREEGAQSQDGFGAVQVPASAGLLHAVLDQVTAGALDDPRRDG